MNRKNVGLALVTTMLIAGCAGGGSATTTVPPRTPAPTTSAYVVTGVDGKQYTVPPEPDASVNKATVAGIDSNGDGIRDDVERWIAGTWKPGSKEFFAVRQFAREGQGFVTDISSINSVTKHTKMDITAKALECARGAYPGFSGKGGDDLIATLKGQTLNTAARWKANEDGESKLGGALSDGKYFGLPEAAVCEGR